MIRNKRCTWLFKTQLGLGLEFLPKGPNEHGGTRTQSWFTMTLKGSSDVVSNSLVEEYAEESETNVFFHEDDATKIIALLLSVPQIRNKAFVAHPTEPWVLSEELKNLLKPFLETL